MNRSTRCSCGGQGQRPGRIDAPGLEFRPPSPVADLRSAVENQTGPSDGRGTCGGIGQITPQDFDFDALEKLGRTSGPHQRTNPVTPRSELLGQVTAEKACRAGDQDAIAGAVQL